MKNGTLISEIRKNTEQILSCKDDFYLMKSAVDNLYKIFSENSGVYIDFLNYHEIMLPTGKAISPASAAHCLVEFRRTTIFLRGIQKAIQKKRLEKGKTIKILYAGSGPYATLITPLLSLYEPSDIRITIMDINKISLIAAEKLIATIGFDPFIDEFILEDATQFKGADKYDLIISETMQSCLENEPQVHIMNNLIPQMKADAIFIPEEISIDVYLSDPDLLNQLLLYENQDKKIQYKKFISSFITLTKESLNSLKVKLALEIPPLEANFKDIMLYTFIRVFDEEKLKERECSLNLPKKFYDLATQKINNIEFWLDYEGIPKIQTKIIKPERSQFMN